LNNHKIKKYNLNVMRAFIITIVTVLITLAAKPMNAQDRVRQIGIETEPMAYILGGAGATASYQHSRWTYSIEAFGELTVPESLHGNQGFESSLKGIELQVERFLTGTKGFYLGPEVGISNLEITHKPSKNSQTKTGFSVGLRAGYHWNTGLGNLYLSPVGGLSYALNSEDIQIQNEKFENESVTPWAKVGIGWSF
jgi:hypothetical protein